METINIQFQVPSTGQYTLDEFVAKLKDYAEKLASSISVNIRLTNLSLSSKTMLKN